jgi:hypothetical protein
MTVFCHPAATVTSVQGTNRRRRTVTKQHDASDIYCVDRVRVQTIPGSIIPSKVRHFIPTRHVCVCAYPICFYCSCDPLAINLEFISGQVRLPFLRTSFLITSEPPYVCSSIWPLSHSQRLTYLLTHSTVQSPS